jgi:predicted RNase H-like nuclease (RuvC/YqgF family)
MITNLSISVLWLPVITLISAYAGFYFRSSQIKKSKKRILYLENEMLQNHAEILKLQQELVETEKIYGLGHKSRVVPMKDSQADGNSEAGQKKKSNK